MIYYNLPPKGANKGLKLCIDNIQKLLRVL